MLRRQQLSPVTRDLVVLRAAVVVRDAPVRPYRAVELQAVERRIERALLDLQDLVRQQVNGLGDRVAVQPRRAERMEDQQVERALEQGRRSDLPTGSPL